MKQLLKNVIRQKAMQAVMDRLSLVQASLLQVEKRVEGTPVFVQVGANDGVSFDPFCEVTKRWRGLMIEPQPMVFKELQSARGAQKGLQFANAAIAPQRGRILLYELSFSLGSLGSALASTDRGTLQKHIDNGYVAECARQIGVSLPPESSAWIMEREVECYPLGDLLERYILPAVNVLLVDTEGYDFQVLQTYPWEKTMPELVIYEEMHLQKSALLECRAFLKDRGYALVGCEANVIAVLGL